MNMIHKNDGEKENHIEKFSTLRWNLNVCNIIRSFIKSTLGPYSMDKLFLSKEKGKILTNDGATILRLLNLNHPASKIMAEIANSQDFEIGDGTTSICILAAELLSAMTELVENGFHPFQISRGFKKGGSIAIEILQKVKKRVDLDSDTTLRRILNSCCSTTLNSKIIAGKRHVFSKMLIDIFLKSPDFCDPSAISIKTVKGGGTGDTFYFSGIAIRKPFVYAGFEKQVKKFYYPKILLLDLDLEIQNDLDNTEAKIKTMINYKEILDAEWSIFYEKLDKIYKIGVNCVFSSKSIGDLATQYFSERGILCGGRVPLEDLSKLKSATKGEILSSLSDLEKDDLGKCKLVEEKQIGNEKIIFLTGLSVNFVTIILRSPNKKLAEEVKRCIEDGVRIVSQTIKDPFVVGGAGSIEMKISSLLKKYAKTIIGTERDIMLKFADCFEIIPKTLCNNAGIDQLEILGKLRKCHQNELDWSGVDLENGRIFNSIRNFVIEPSSLKANIIQGSLEAASIIFNIDSAIIQ